MNRNTKSLRKNAYGFATSAQQRDTQTSQLSHKELWSAFKDRTTAHGVSPIADAKSMFAVSDISYM